MKNILLIGLVIIAISILGTTSCTTDKLPEPVPPMLCDTLTPTYDNEMQAIINTNCAYAGCHVAGGAPGDYSSFASMLPALENNRVREKVIDLVDDPDLGMPPSYASGPQDLTAEEFDLFTCWLANGYPEN